MKRTMILVGAMMAVASLPSVALGVSYAQELSWTSDDVSFRLNQAANNVEVILDGTTTVYSGPLGKGYHTLAGILTGQTYTNFCVRAASLAGSGPHSNYTQISNDADTTSKYYSPKGVTVDTNPLSPYFGRIYVAEGLGGATASGRTTTDGIYVMACDQSDITGQGDTAYGGGIDWTTGGSNSPFKLGLNRTDPENRLFITDWSDLHSGIWTADTSNMGAAFNPLLDNTGRDAAGLVMENFGVGPLPLHGSVASTWVEGTGTDRKMYTLDEDADLGSTTGSILRYDIGNTASNYATAPVEQTQDGPNIILNLLADVVRDEDGSWWIAQYRYTDAAACPSLSHWADGASSPSWVSGPGTIPLDVAYGSIDIWQVDDECAGDTLDRNLIVMGTRGGKYYVLEIDDAGFPHLVATVPHAGSYIRDVAFDAAGNIYAVSNSSETLRIYSPGGEWLTCLCSDGTFNVVPEPASLSLLALGGLALLRRRR